MRCATCKLRYLVDQGLGHTEEMASLVGVIQHHLVTEMAVASFSRCSLIFSVTEERGNNLVP